MINMIPDVGTKAKKCCYIYSYCYIVTIVLLINELPYQLSIIVISINHFRKRINNKEQIVVHFLIRSVLTRSC